MLNVHRVRLLVELHDRGTIRAVADALHYTPSSVSEALSALEREVGVPLLDRGPRSVRLTPAGEALARHGREIVERLSAARSIAVAVGDGGGASVAIATFPSAGATIVADAVARLRAADGGVRVRLVEAEPDEALRRLRAGEVDLALVYEFGLLPDRRDPELATVELRQEAMKVCLAPSDAALHDGPIALAGLRDRAFVAGPAGSPCHDFTTAACRSAGFEPRIDYESDDPALTCSLVRAGLCVALMPQAFIDTSPDPVPTVDCPDLPPRRLLLAERAAGRPSATVRAARDELLAA